MNVVEFTPASILSRSPDMISGQVDADIILTSIESGLYFQLNPIGGFILGLLEEPTTLAGLSASLQARFGIGPDTLAQDLHPFLARLAARGIIQVA